MAKYPDRYPRDSFKTQLLVIHRPTGFQFVQYGGRIKVWKREDGTNLYKPFTDFTTYDLQVEGTILTEAALIRAAIVWMQNNP